MHQELGELILVPLKCEELLVLRPGLAQQLLGGAPGLFDFLNAPCLDPPLHLGAGEGQPRAGAPAWLPYWLRMATSSSTTAAIATAP